MIERLDANLFPAHVTLSEAKGLPGWWLADSSSPPALLRITVLGEVELAGTNTTATSSSRYETTQALRSIPMEKILFTVAGLIIALAVACSGDATSEPTGGATVTPTATTVPKIEYPTPRPVQEWRLQEVSVEGNAVTV